jgi:hypothetical protein
MNYCLIYIFLLFLISLVFLNLVRYHSDKKIEGMVNILDITLKDLENDSKLGLPDIKVDPDLVNNYTISDNIGPEFFKSRFKKYDVPLKNITRQGTEKYNRQMLYDEKYPDYAPYENIVPIFKKDHKIRGQNKKYYSRESVSDEIYETGRITGLPEVNVTDCQGKWNDWDETHCIPNNRCSLRFRTYNVTREATLDGDQCKYDGQEVFDGDIDYDYCYGNNNKDRCGIDNADVCACDLDNYDSEKCDFELSNDECICPTGYPLKSGSGTDSGKCVSDTVTSAVTSTVPVSDTVTSTGTSTVPFTPQQMDYINNLIAQRQVQARVPVQRQAPVPVQGQGQTQPQSGQGTGLSGLGIASMLRFAMAEEYLREAEDVQRGEEFDEDEFDKRMAIIAAKNLNPESD